MVVTKWLLDDQQLFRLILTIAKLRLYKDKQLTIMIKYWVVKTVI